MYTNNRIIKNNNNIERSFNISKGNLRDLRTNDLKELDITNNEVIQSLLKHINIKGYSNNDIQNISVIGFDTDSQLKSLYSTQNLIDLFNDIGLDFNMIGDSSDIKSQALSNKRIRDVDFEIYNDINNINSCVELKYKDFLLKFKNDITQYFFIDYTEIATYQYYYKFKDYKFIFNRNHDFYVLNGDILNIYLDILKNELKYNYDLFYLYRIPYRILYKLTSKEDLVKEIKIDTEYLKDFALKHLELIDLFKNDYNLTGITLKQEHQYYRRNLYKTA